MGGMVDRIGSVLQKDGGMFPECAASFQPWKGGVLIEREREQEVVNFSRYNHRGTEYTCGQWPGQSLYKNGTLTHRLHQPPRKPAHDNSVTSPGCQPAIYKFLQKL